MDSRNCAYSDWTSVIRKRHIDQLLASENNRNFQPVTYIPALANESNAAGKHQWTCKTNKRFKNQIRKWMKRNNLVLSNDILAEFDRNQLDLDMIVKTVYRVCIGCEHIWTP